MTADAKTEPDTRNADRMPWPGLIALFFAGFLTIINETMPAGLLPKMAGSLHLSQSVAGQTVTIYALATAVTAVPLSALLARWGRRTVLASALAAFVVANLAIALTDNFTVIMVARFIAGVGAGLIWSNLAVYAARLAPPALQGRAMAIANAGQRRLRANPPCRRAGFPGAGPVTTRWVTALFEGGSDSARPPKPTRGDDGEIGSSTLHAD